MLGCSAIARQENVCAASHFPAKGFLKKPGVGKPGFWCLLLATGLLWVASPLTAQETQQHLEFRGQIMLPNHTLSPRERISLTLFGVGSPFRSQTSADSKGRFRFRDLDPGTYSLSTYIPGAGEILQTVEITESLADRKGRVEKEFRFDVQSLRRKARPVPLGLVSVRELTISSNARR